MYYSYIGTHYFRPFFVLNGHPPGQQLLKRTREQKQNRITSSGPLTFSYKTRKMKRIQCKKYSFKCEPRERHQKSKQNNKKAKARKKQKHKTFRFLEIDLPQLFLSHTTVHSNRTRDIFVVFFLRTCLVLPREYGRVHDIRRQAARIQVGSYFNQSFSC